MKKTKAKLLATPNIAHQTGIHQDQPVPTQLKKVDSSEQGSGVQLHAINKGANDKTSQLNVSQHGNQTNRVGEKQVAHLVSQPIPASSSASHLQQLKPEGSCPFCQMPLAVLRVDSPRWHVAECMDLPIIATQGMSWVRATLHYRGLCLVLHYFVVRFTECPEGVSCGSTLPSHFRKFRHTLLANARAGIPPVKQTGNCWRKLPSSSFSFRCWFSRSRGAHEKTSAIQLFRTNNVPRASHFLRSQNVKFMFNLWLKVSHTEISTGN